MMRLASSLAGLLLCGSLLSGCASDDGGGLMENLGQHKNLASATDGDALPTDVDSGVRQAQLAWPTGHCDDAIHTLSQLMLVACDDPRVVGDMARP